MDEREKFLIYRVREILEKKEIGLMKVPQFQDFPHGSCSDASEILGCILEQNGFGPYQLVSGTNNKGRTHAWLQSDNHRIDITADQFSSELAPVLIGNIGLNSKMHIGFSVKNTRQVNLQSIFQYGSGPILIFLTKMLAGD